MRRSPSREAELTTRLLKLREHRARLLAASRQQVGTGGDELARRRMIAHADGQIVRIERALRRAYLKRPAVP
jgi:hypothetical protein